MQSLSDGEPGATRSWRIRGERALVADVVESLTSAAEASLTVEYYELPPTLLSRRKLGQFELIEVVVTLVTSVASPIVVSEIQRRIEEARRSKQTTKLSIQPEPTHIEKNATDSQ